MAYGYPGGNAGNTYVPMLELSGHLLVNFARNMKLSVNRYARVTPVQKKRGAYLQFNPLDVARMQAPDTQFVWAPGTPSPDGFAIEQGFQEKEFTCFRKAFPTTLDMESVDVANWDVKKSYGELLAQTAMTHRIYAVVAKMVDSTQYASTHVKTAKQLNGSNTFLDAGTTATPAIKQTLDAAALVIQTDTFSRVKWGTLTVVINPNTAIKWSQSRELREYLMQHADAIKEITLDDSNYNAAYGLPKRLYGFNIVVEEAVYNTANRGNASEAGTFVFPDNKAVVVLAEGDLEKSEGTYSFNTWHIFAYEDMTTEEKVESWDRLVKMRVVMNYDIQPVAPVTGFLITNLFS